MWLNKGVLVDLHSIYFLTIFHRPYIISNEILDFIDRIKMRCPIKDNILHRDKRNLIDNQDSTSKKEFGRTLIGRFLFNEL